MIRVAAITLTTCVRFLPVLTGCACKHTELDRHSPTLRCPSRAEDNTTWKEKLKFVTEIRRVRGKSSRPTVPCGGPRMNPSLDDGNPPRPIRHLRMAEHRSPDPSSSRAPVHSVLVQKSVTAITNPVGRLSCWMLGKRGAMRKGSGRKSWHGACNQSNAMWHSSLEISRPEPCFRKSI